MFIPIMYRWTYIIHIFLVVKTRPHLLCGGFFNISFCLFVCYTLGTYYLEISYYMSWLKTQEKKKTISVCKSFCLCISIGWRAVNRHTIICGSRVLNSKYYFGIYQIVKVARTMQTTRRVGYNVCCGWLVGSGT